MSSRSVARVSSLAVSPVPPLSSAERTAAHDPTAATSRAYDEGLFTISIVTARSVGIGAYLVRLGQRSIQVEGNPIILTGAPALNKVLGREVYTSNLQLGGTQIMARNGTSHLVAESDLDGAFKCIKWLAFVPDRKGKAIPISPSQDAWDREVTYQPPKGPYDPRWLLQGKEDEGLTGLFDKGSFFVCPLALSLLSGVA